MRFIFVKNAPNFMYISKLKSKIEKKMLVFRIIVFELVIVNYPYY